MGAGKMAAVWKGQGYGNKTKRAFIYADPVRQKNSVVKNWCVNILIPYLWKIKVIHYKYNISFSWVLFSKHFSTWFVPSLFDRHPAMGFPFCLVFVIFRSLLSRRALLLLWRQDNYTPAPPPFGDKILRLQPDTLSVSYKRQSCNSLQRHPASNHSTPIN